MTRPYTRACRQTNFSEGAFVNKVPFPLFFFFISFSFSYLLSFLFLTFLPFSPFFAIGVHGPLGGGGPSDYTGEIGRQI